MRSALTILDNSPIRFMVELPLEVEYLDFAIEQSRLVCPPKVFESETNKRKLQFKYRHFVETLGENWYAAVNSLSDPEEVIESIAETSSSVKRLCNLAGQHLAAQDLEVAAAGVVLSNYF